MTEEEKERARQLQREHAAAFARAAIATAEIVRQVLKGVPGQVPAETTDTPTLTHLHAGQTWRLPDGTEATITYRGHMAEADWTSIGGHSVYVNADWTVADMRGAVLVAGLGADS